MLNQFSRTQLLLGAEAMEKLKGARVAVFGIGGVGGYVCEALVRSGVGAFDLVDDDKVCLTNLNRQIIADITTVGRSKTEVACERAKKINPEINISGLEIFADAGNIDSLIDGASPDFIIDAIDTVTAKIAIIKAAKARNIPVISSMGTGAKLDPTKFRICDISKTHTCPLAKVMRLKLRENGINHCDVLFSDELPVKALTASELEGKTVRNIPGSISFVPSVAGLIIAGEVVRRLSAAEETDER